MQPGSSDLAGHGERPPAEPGAAEARDLRRNYLAALSYPLFHLAAPEGARDPWVLWWLVGCSFALVMLASMVNGWAARNARNLFPLGSWLVTLHLYTLAHWNDMSPFYVVGSVMAALTSAVSMRNRRGLLAYTAYLVALTATLFRMDPSTTKLAYWGGVFCMMPLFYLRLDWQRRRDELARDMADELEARVQERTAEVVEAKERLEAEIAERERLEGQLRLSHKMEVLGRIAGGLAHDFNNLLTTVNIYSDLVLDRLEADTPLYRDAEQIQKTTRLASVLTQQLLDLSRGSADAIVIDMNEAVLEVSQMVRGVLPSSIEFDYEVADQPACVRAGPDQLSRVLMNLIMNARDAMPEGGHVRVGVSIRKDGFPDGFTAEPGARYVLLTVTDTGHGMDAETLSKAFDPFFTLKTDREGSGLGLSIVYGIVEQGGGHIRALSEPGLGTRFEVYWPLDEKASVAAPVLKEGEAREFGAERILLVEDEEALRVVLARVLDEAGYAVVDVPDGDVALAALAREPQGFDLVVSDVVMPNMNGYELAEQLRRKHPETRVLLMSAQPNHPSLGDRRAPPGIELLAKPFEVGDLAAKVRSVLETPLPG